MPTLEPERIQLPKLNRQKIQITLIGDTSLICHRFSEKAKKEMLDKMMKKAKTERAPKDPEREYLESLYVIDGEMYGFPAIGFKMAAVTAANDAGIQKTLARRSFHVLDPNGEFSKDDLVPIIGTPASREDVVMLQGRTADLRYRGEFKEWRVMLHIDYNAGVISAEQVINLFQLAGFGVGVGDWRPEKDGMHGLFHVMTEGE